MLELPESAILLCYLHRPSMVVAFHGFGQGCGSALGISSLSSQDIEIKQDRNKINN
jgi:hypothetical protein